MAPTRLPLRTAVALTLALTLAAPGLAHAGSGPQKATATEANSYALDAGHSRVGFKVRHMMVSWTRGHFTKVSGDIRYDPAAPARTTARVTIDVSSIDTGEPKRDGHLRAADFFDVANHPTMTFVSTGVSGVTKDGFDLTGDLTIKGVTRPVTLKVTDVQGPVKNPWGKHVVGAHAEAVIDRTQFGLTWRKTLEGGGLVVGKEVRLSFDVEAMR